MASRQMWRLYKLGLFVGAMAAASCGPKLEPGASIETGEPATTDPNATASDSNTTATTGTGTGTGTGSTTGQTLCGTTSTSITYTNNAQTVVAARCAICHSPSGSHPNPDLSTYATAKSGMSGSGLVQVDSGEMPPSNSKGGSLTTNEKCIIDAWAKAGYTQ
jgi:uncharacterized membrane protein